ncbi:hypothetical protein [Frankia sp. AiPa1]|uniref:hypothetical protein n=1 Tax=Frankia sp. AiPa1 TaxID=573492 RepID=UPI00202B585C|nr:hypothetical protein [Frankia sp. AiPa1]MCL9758394.1 hypothetical protein [Frankia sp. AiPa1]
MVNALMDGVGREVVGLRGLPAASGATSPAVCVTVLAAFAEARVDAKSAVVGGTVAPSVRFRNTGMSGMTARGVAAQWSPELAGQPMRVALPIVRPSTGQLSAAKSYAAALLAAVASAPADAYGLPSTHRHLMSGSVLDPLPG